MAVEIFDQIYVYINGQPLKNCTGMEHSTENNDQDVFTIFGGFAGQTPSPKKAVTSIEGVLPVTGFGFDFEGAESKSEIVELKLQKGGNGESKLTKGFIRNARVRAGTGETVSVSFEHHGEYTEFK